MELTLGSGVWLGQHSHKHGLFKVWHKEHTHTDSDTTEHAPHQILPGRVCHSRSRQWGGRKTRVRSRFNAGGPQILFESSALFCLCFELRIPKANVMPNFRCSFSLYPACSHRQGDTLEYHQDMHTHFIFIVLLPTCHAINGPPVFFPCDILISHVALLWGKLFLLHMLWYNRCYSTVLFFPACLLSFIHLFRKKASESLILIVHPYLPPNHSLHQPPCADMHMEIFMTEAEILYR